MECYNNWIFCDFKPVTSERRLLCKSTSASYVRLVLPQPFLATVGLVTPSAFLSPHWQPWVTRRLQLLSSTTAVACARPALQVMMLLEQFSPPSWADQRCQELWLAWIRRIAMWETRHRASEVFWPWSIPLSTALSPIGMTWKLVCFMLNPLWVHDVS